MTNHGNKTETKLNYCWSINWDFAYSLVTWRRQSLNAKLLSFWTCFINSLSGFLWASVSKAKAEAAMISKVKLLISLKCKGRMITYHPSFLWLISPVTVISLHFYHMHFPCALCNFPIKSLQSFFSTKFWAIAC